MVDGWLVAWNHAEDSISEINIEEMILEEALPMGWINFMRLEEASCSKKNVL